MVPFLSFGSGTFMLILIIHLMPKLATFAPHQGEAP